MEITTFETPNSGHVQLKTRAKMKYKPNIMNKATANGFGMDDGFDRPPWG